jgi:hypothetical protein
MAKGGYIHIRGIREDGESCPLFFCTINRNVGNVRNVGKKSLFFRSTPRGFPDYQKCAFAIVL